MCVCCCYHIISYHIISYHIISYHNKNSKTYIAHSVTEIESEALQQLMVISEITWQKNHAVLAGYGRIYDLNVWFWLKVLIKSQDYNNGISRKCNVAHISAINNQYEWDLMYCWWADRCIVHIFRLTCDVYVRTRSRWRSFLRIGLQRSENALAVANHWDANQLEILIHQNINITIRAKRCPVYNNVSKTIYYTCALLLN